MHNDKIRNKRINIGCGQSPTPGWYNLDSSFSILLRNYPRIAFILNSLGFLTKGQKEFITFARANDIRWANATKRLPLPDKSIEVVYTSHMIEHLDKEEVKHFFREISRIIIPKGIIRIAIPDLNKMTIKYINDGDVDAHIKSTGLTRVKPKTIVQKLKYLITSDRGHKWLYDGPSMVHLLSSLGFNNPKIMPPGQTMIPDPGTLNLYERLDESVYIEAYNS